MPASLSLPSCPECWIDRWDGDVEGWSHGMAQIIHRLTAHEEIPRVPADSADALIVAVCVRPLVQDEVDALIAKGQLRAGTRAEDLNVRRLDPRRPSLRTDIVIHRCMQAGFDPWCPNCHGAGHLGTVEQIAAYDAWRPEDPPVGPGWQLWETTGGSPISPVFATADDLASWMSDPARDAAWVPQAVAAQFIAEGYAADGYTRGGDVISGVEFKGYQPPAG